MSLRLRNRNRPIPNGIPAYDPVTRYRGKTYDSFDVQVRGIQAARRANPGACQRNGNAPTDTAAIEEFVDAQLAQICKQNNWVDFIEGDAQAQPPFGNQTRNQGSQSMGQSVRNVAAGSAVLVEWIASGAEAVPQEMANKRAATCAVCPLNEKGDWTRWFTLPVSEAIRNALHLRRDMNLSTNDDDNLNICGACLCPLKLKVHVPLDQILSKMPVDVQNALDQNCWIRNKDA